ncbi:hypothetical protein ACJMK2_023935 [Sinanodonta woodiana]|uniref:Uncharacterized protein n=1 Tax=Sinanodonta woodiana TaxID=1069815 RepID=A0ABD3T5M5_SINWO
MEYLLFTKEKKKKINIISALNVDANIHSTRDQDHALSEGDAFVYRSYDDQLKEATIPPPYSTCLVAGAYLNIQAWKDCESPATVLKLYNYIIN